MSSTAIRRQCRRLIPWVSSVAAAALPRFLFDIFRTNSANRFHIVAQMGVQWEKVHHHQQLPADKFVTSIMTITFFYLVFYTYEANRDARAQNED
jgi:hypothetical protein